MISKKLFIYLVLIGAIGFVVGIFFFKTNEPKHFIEGEGANAASANKTLSTQADWESTGTILSNINLTIPSGNITIDNLGESEIDIFGATLTATYNDAVKGNIIDGDENTQWEASGLQAHPDPGVTQSITVDLGQNYTISKIRGLATSDAGGIGWVNMFFQTSTDGISFTPQSSPMLSGTKTWHEVSSLSVTARYIRYYFTYNIADSSSTNAHLYEVEIYQAGATATHTTAPSQIDGASDFYEWEQFTPTQSVPANTTVSYKFRSSPDYSSWTSWTSSQTYSGTPFDLSSLVTSRVTVGDATTYYRYLQVETTLTSSDGVANPSISDYTINYHTNLKPNKPTAQTAVVGS